MRLSGLQKTILKIAVQMKLHKVPRGIFAASAAVSTKILTRSFERLIDRECMIGYGVRTPHKWFIKEIQLTEKGRREAKKLFGTQQMIPFAKRSGEG